MSDETTTEADTTSAASDCSSPGDPDWTEFPERVELCFRSKADRDEFMGGLSDGFGEEFCQLDWPWKSAPRLASGAIVGFDTQPRFAVTVYEPDVR